MALTQFIDEDRTSFTEVENYGHSSENFEVKR